VGLPLIEKDYLVLKRAWASRPGEWSDDDYDVLSDGAVIGRIQGHHRARRKLDADPGGTSPFPLRVALLNFAMAGFELL
jgi:hypothetical protein